MIERDDDGIVLQHPEGWQARHGLERGGGPDEVRLNGTPILQDCGFHFDEIPDRSAVPRRIRDFRKGGAGVVAVEGYFPFGSEIRFKQTCRYAANHVRVSFDLNWPRRAVVRRHFGLGGMFLPGEWTRLFCVPPALHWAEGVTPWDRAVPPYQGTSQMIAHWHRPPAAMVFTRADGVRVEIGTGFDIWRWEHCLGYGPESGSYKVFVEEGGIRLVREPLMCCEQFEPPARPYRFTWYAAWDCGVRKSEAVEMPAASSRVALDSPAEQLSDERGGEMCVDVSREEWSPEHCRTPDPAALVRQRVLEAACWQSSGPQQRFRTFVRRLHAAESPAGLTVLGLQPGCCWHGSHVNQGSKPIPHWDLPALLDLAVWTRQQLGAACAICCEPVGIGRELPSMTGLFGRNGFEVE